MHLRLVENILSYVERTYRHSYHLVVFHDLPALIRAEKPPRIGGFVPDVYAVDAPPSILIIGEAKTQCDLDTDHSQRQLIAFLKHLALQPNGQLVLAVPWTASATARNLLRRLKLESSCETVHSVVIDDTTMVDPC